MDYRYVKLSKNAYTYLIIDKKLLHKIIDLQDNLRAKGLNPKGFWIRDGQRAPDWNFKRGGVDGSRHIRGEAADIIVEDINLDDVADQMDKDILIDILDQEIIQSEGGIGRYPGGMVIHFDTRGYRARWDHQKPRK